MSLIVGCCAIGVPLSMSASEITTESTGVIQASEELEGGAGGGGQQCNSIKDRVVNSVLYLMDLKKGSKESNSGTTSTNSLGRSCLGAKVIKINRGYEKEKSMKAKSDDAQWERGIESLIDIAIERLEGQKGLSTWGGEKWGSSWIGENGSSLYLTGVSLVGEYLVWKEELQRDIKKTNGEVLVALKEQSATDEKISLKIGWQEWKKKDESPQIQIEKQNMQDWKVLVEFRRFGSSEK